MAALTYRSFVAQAQDYLRKGAAAEADLLYLLLEVEPLTILWGAKHASWTAVLRTLHLTTPTRYSRFKAAAQEFSRVEIQRLGVSGTILLSHVPPKFRQPVKTKALAWWAKHRVPLLPHVAQDLIREVSPVTMDGRVKLTVGNWRKRAHRLEALLLKHGIKVPPLEVNLDQDLERTLDASVTFVRAQFRLKQAYPSCSVEDIARIAMEQVETASVALKQVLMLPEKKSKLSGKGRSTRVVDDEMIRKAIDEASLESPNFLTSGMVMEHFKGNDLQGHGRLIQGRITGFMQGSSEFHQVAKVGTMLAFRRVRSSLASLQDLDKPGKLDPMVNRGG